MPCGRNPVDDLVRDRVGPVPTCAPRCAHGVGQVPAPGSPAPRGGLSPIPQSLPPRQHLYWLRLSIMASLTADACDNLTEIAGRVPQPSVRLGAECVTS